VLNPPDYLCADGLGGDFAAEGSICIERGGAGAACTNDRVCADETSANSRHSSAPSG
jgi:hypothetical protein